MPGESIEDFLMFVPKGVNHFIYVDFRDTFGNEGFRQRLLAYMESNKSGQITTIFGALDDIQFRMGQYMERLKPVKQFSFYVASTGERGLFLITFNETESRMRDVRENAQSTGSVGSENFYCLGLTCVYSKGSLMLIGEKDSLIESLNTAFSNQSLSTTRGDYVVYMNKPDMDAMSGINLSTGEVDSLLLNMNVSDAKLNVMVKSRYESLSTNLNFTKNDGYFALEKSLDEGEVMEQFFRLFIYILTTGVV
jgi:hypothetical protein